jgi:uridine kinase
MELTALSRDRGFLIGLFIRLALLAAVTPARHIAVAATLPTLPAAVVTTLLGMAVLAADIAVFALLSRTGSPERRSEVAALYWLSPLTIWVLYCAGSVAVMIGAVLIVGFVAIERRRYALAGAAFGLAMAAEPALILLVGPLGLIFAANLARLRAGALYMALAAAGAFVLAALPPVLSHGVGGWIASSALPGLFDLQLPLASGAGIALLPLILTGSCYVAWRARLLDRDLLWTFITLALLSAVAAEAATPALILLLVIFLCHHAAYAERSGRALLLALSGGLLIQLALFETGPAIAGISNGAPLAAGLFPLTWLAPIAFVLTTTIAAIAVILWIQAFQRGVLRASSYLATRRPFAIGIAGDSGVGKDTLSDAVAALFSARTVATVSGDDYHNWDRNKPMWRALTHLNPKANDLTQFGSHVTQLIDRRWVRARHYDHTTGRMTKPLLTRPGEIVLASGLHALSSPALNGLYDLRIFLDMDEELRRFFKIRRDVNVRGHPLQRVIASLERRHADAEAFIHPQKATADLVFRLEPRRREMLTSYDTSVVPMRLVVDAVPGMAFDHVVRTLVAICGIQAVEYPLPSGASRLVVEGEPSRADVAAAARRLAPGMRDLMDDTPGWEGGLNGVLQLIILDQLETVRNRRSVNA